jgi:glycosyltransferase involved in cell wall biosynthesis
VDDFSEDKTVQISESLGARVLQRHWDGFVGQKNFAITHSEREWVLILDADERVSEPLAQELQALTSVPSDRSAYRIPFRLHFLGKPIRYGGWGKGYFVHRLIRRGAASYSERCVHERLIISGSESDLRGVIDHYPYRDLSAMVRKQDRYSALEARDLFNSGHRPVAKRDFVLRPLLYWISRYVWHGGFLDGPEGLILASGHALCRLLVMAKLWEMQCRGRD